MNDRVYTISTTATQSGVLRIPSDLSTALGRRGRVNGRLVDDRGRTHPVTINLADRTLIGLGDWLRTQGEATIEYISLRITRREPLEGSLSASVGEVDPSCEPSSVSSMNHRPSRSLYLGERLDRKFLELRPTGEPYLLEPRDLLRHVFICGVTGAGKTVLGKGIIEEAARLRIPCVMVDLKGDLSSMALLVSGEDPADLLAYASPREGESREDAAVRETGRHRKNLQRWGITSDDIDELRSRIATNVFTPRSSAGFRLALSAFVHPPDDPIAMRENSPDEYEEVVDFLSYSFVARLTLSRKQAEKAHGYVCEIIKLFWERDHTIEGYRGLKRVLDEIRTDQSGIPQVGGMPLHEYITDRDRSEISTAVNRLLTGAAKLWFLGIPLDVGLFIDPILYGKKTPVSIVNVQHLAFEDQAYVVAYLAYMVWFWMRRQPGTEDPRLLFFVDEIGGGGGKRALFPSVASSPAKAPLNLLLRQGRSQGVCCVFATQNPGDIDYKGLSNCGTWAVGQLKTKRDRGKIEQGAGDADLDFESAKAFIPRLQPGQFVIRTPTQTWEILQERWLASIHRTLANQEIRGLRDAYERRAADLLEDAKTQCDGTNLDRAISLLNTLLREYRFSDLCSAAHLLKGRCLFTRGSFTEARETLHLIDKRFFDCEEAGEARLLIGKCHEREGNYADALRAFVDVSSRSAGQIVLRQAELHSEVCRTFVEWPQLSTLKRVVLWLFRRAPDQARLERLEDIDDELVAHAVECAMPAASLYVPPVIDLTKLNRLERESEIKTRKLEQWAIRKATSIRNHLDAGDLEKARRIAEQVVQRLDGDSCPLPPETTAAIRSFNAARQVAWEDVTGRITAIQAKAFEEEVAGWVAELGYKTWVTKISGDGGVDVWAISGTEQIAIQCKRWKQSIGPGPVRELRGAMEQSKADRAILVSLSGFTEGAQAAARELGVELWDAAQLFQAASKK
ncbi:helicase HerA-like domain-containing protein [Candidatus Eisenbacteria bacterium]|uniref:Helicase HerA-like domain-containing protein n=1 Tax=Eiseniibacteriota bacterium TaxID=2212470 RepID=A0ABV6YJC2_UNCEI